MDLSKQIEQILTNVDDFMWGVPTLVLLVGTGIFLTIRLKFLPWRNLFPSLKKLISPESRKKTDGGTGDVSPFNALMTALAATIGTGNIVGVATAMAAGGAGALVWMWISAAFGITTKFTECALAIKYRTVNARGEMLGGPMYAIKAAFKGNIIGKILGVCFAVFAVLASFGIGNLTQANSISSALDTTFSVPTWITGLVIAVFALAIILGGIQIISRVSGVLVPGMAIFYIIGGIIVIIGNFQNLGAGIVEIFSMAFTGRSVAGGVAGTATVVILNSIKSGVSRGVFSNEAGMGSAAITAAAAHTDNHVKQGYINMCGTFIDTILVCSITGLAIASSGVLHTQPDLEGVNITIAAFETVLGPVGGYLVTIGLILFAFSTILGWEYHGEKALEYLVKKPVFCYAYRIIFALVTYVGATVSLGIVWKFSDIANALMIIPNVIGMLLLSNVIAKDTDKYQLVLNKEKEQRRLAKRNRKTSS